VGFYIRKSMRLWPVRFNLSKSGLGASVGVRGLRLGSGPRGTYVHAGRGGLYYHFTFRDIPELAIVMSNIQPHELQAMQSKTFYFAFALRGPVIFFLYHLADAFPWSDAPFSVHLMNEGEREALLEQDVTSRTHILMRILFVDRQTQRIAAMRMLTLPPHFMREVLAAVRAQWE
jgi:hypothetical protein